MNPPPVPSTRRRILIADDSSQIRECLVQLLEAARYEVVEAANGHEALERLSGQDIDLVLLDLNMPELDGWQTLEQLRLRHPALPVIVITAQPNQQDWIRNPAAVALFEKPLDLPLLFRTLDEIIPFETGDGASPNPTATPTPRPFRYGRPRSDTDFMERSRVSSLNE